MLDKSVLRIIFHYHVEAGFVQNYKFVHLRKYTCNRSTAIIVFLDPFPIVKRFTKLKVCLIIRTDELLQG